MPTRMVKRATSNAAILMSSPPSPIKFNPSEIVVDEAVGMWLALAGLPRHGAILFLAFLLFRCFDIAKFPPMKQLERLPGGVGIMLDDIAAGLLTRLALTAILAFTGHAA